MEKFKYVVCGEDKGLAVKDLMRRRFTFSGRLMTKLKKNNAILLNGNPTEGWITPKVGDIISILLPEESSDFPPEPIPISVIFEDSDLLIINKQPGIVVHPTKGHPRCTIAGGLTQYMLDTGQRFKIRFINRLDMDTSGLLAIAKNSHSQDGFVKQMQQHRVEKRYKAIVKGTIVPDEGTIDLPVGLPDPEKPQRAVFEGGRPSVTHYRVLERLPQGSGYTLVELFLETGRTHQIRVHLSYIGHPVVGDHLYGGENVTLIDRQALHAASLSFCHPVTGEQMQLTAPLPEDMQRLLNKLML